MSRRPAILTQADVARVIRAAKQTGAAEVEVKTEKASIIVRLAASTGEKMPLEQTEEIVL
jgi:DNA-binding XRE family transcriptional regulator